MGQSQQHLMQDDEAFNKEWNHLSKINNSRMADDEFMNESMTDIHKSPVNRADDNAQPAFSSNWTPLSSSTNVKDIIKRTDSKDSGWNFSEKPANTSESDNDQLELTSRDSTEKFATSEETKGVNNSLAKTVECSDHERTSNGGQKLAADCIVTKSCDNTDFNDEEPLSGEFTPLVNKESFKQNCAEGDS